MTEQLKLSSVWQPTSAASLRRENLLLREENIELKEKIRRLEQMLLKDETLVGRQ